MPRALTFYAFKNYVECPLKHLRQNINRDKPITMQDEYNTVYGTVVQKMFEMFYNDQIWRKGKEARTILKDKVPKVFAEIVAKKNIFWGEHEGGKQLIIDECIVAVDHGIDTVRDYKLLAPYAKSEVNTYAYITKADQIGGRIDFVFKGDGEIRIFDGKGSKYKDRYLDHRQLFWYALSYYLLHRKMPNSLWYWFYRFPEDPLLEVEFTIDTLKELKAEIIDVMQKIKKRQFKATPSSKACKFCPYVGECKFKADKTNKNKSILPEGTSGFVELGLDDDE